GNPVKTEMLSEENIRNKTIDYAFFSAGREVSLEYAPIFQKLGITVIDNSSAWRMNDNVPLVIPQINSEKLVNHKNIIANPNCSTIQSLIPLYILDNKYTVKSVSFTSFQAVSGS
ncbi:MAG: aspartate-semialdehyde dehydrogenase, partial [Clostridia bacterium]|nr:aspartate-semialdehyde dehydrogenase [Clostridia bacterium]